METVLGASARRLAVATAAGGRSPPSATPHSRGLFVTATPSQASLQQRLTRAAARGDAESLDGGSTGSAAAAEGDAVSKYSDPQFGNAIDGAGARRPHAAEAQSALAAPLRAPGSILRPARAPALHSSKRSRRRAGPAPAPEGARASISVRARDVARCDHWRLSRGPGVGVKRQGGEWWSDWLKSNRDGSKKIVRGCCYSCEDSKGTKCTGWDITADERKGESSKGGLAGGSSRAHTLLELGRAVSGIACAEERGSKRPRAAHPKPGATVAGS
ncbi:hypothetical protein PybrP1_005749 [[Pythium] brassicae (nom. inval.)]|nr:hypothetical protein PybrP1_005749 [[Pythium] brassicae (nom. inval.)]